jgi:hypothetical protein
MLNRLLAASDNSIFQADISASPEEEIKFWILADAMVIFH